MSYVFTKIGLEKANSFIKECEAKRKEILDSRKDTADETVLPTTEDILSDMEQDDWMYYDGLYCNSWDVTDNYNSDVFALELGTDFIAMEDKELLQQIVSLVSQASDEVYDDKNENGTQGILDLCDELVEKIDKFLGNE